MTAANPPARSAPERAPIWRGLWALLLANCALLAIDIGRESLWLDEMTSLAISTGPASFAVRFFKQFPEQHPLYYIGLKLWLTMGTSEAVLRAFSALTIPLSMIVLYLLGRRTLGEREARVATALAAFSPFLVYYGQEGRMYAHLMLLTLVSTYVFLRWSEEPTPRRAFLYWLVSVAAVYTHLFAVFAVAAHWCWTLFSPLKRPRFKGATALSAAVAVAYLPWVVFIVLHPSAPQDWKNWVNVVFGIPYTLLRWTVGYSIVLANFEWKQNIVSLARADAPILACAVIGFGAAAVAGARRLITEWREAPGLVLSLLVVPTAFALLLSPKAILLSERYLIVSFPAYLLLIATGLTRLAGARIRALGIAVPALIVVTLAVAFWRYYRDPRFGKASWREVAAFVDASRAPSDALVLHSPAVKDVFLHYAADPALPFAMGPGAIDEVRGAPRVWLVVSHDEDHGDSLVASLEPTYEVVRDTVFPKDLGIRVVELDQRP